MTIAQVSEKYNISKDTLRYYEKVGVMPKVNRNKSGVRDYDDEACNWVGLVKCLRDSGVSIDTLVKYCELMIDGDTTITLRKNLLIDERAKLRSKLNEMQLAVDKLDYKISKYEDAEKTGVLVFD